MAVDQGKMVRIPDRRNLIRFARPLISFFLPFILYLFTLRAYNL